MTNARFIELTQDFTDDLLFNVIVDSDSYKTSHKRQYPPGTQYVFSYLESRGGKFDDQVMFGLQYFLKRYLKGVVITEEMIVLAKEMINAHMGSPDAFNEEGWRYILQEHGGRLPIRICAIAEGTRVRAHNALVTVVNTDPKCFWLVNYLETALMRVWYPISVATLSRNIRTMIEGYLEQSGTPEKIDFMLQDFGSRGVSSQESAAVGGAAHLVNFKGSDTMVAIPFLYRYYGANGMPSFSVPASEHSTITSWGRMRESAAYRNMLTQYPNGIVSIVSDSYDIFNACENIYGVELRESILNRDGVLVIRPDSGEIIPTILRILDILGRRFGYTVNSKGYRVLPPQVRVLQGDGMNFDTIRELCEALLAAGWSIDNIACFGMGGKLLQGVDRDTLKFAFKCCAIDINGVWYEVYKDPITDPGKISKRGVVYVLRNADGELETFTQEQLVPVEGDQLLPVLENGNMLCEYTLDEIRTRANSK
jgi:nicotinamide phosphoribosyltransferase